ncbi:MAG: hypothetical protein WDN31_08055 [Hyphomicrobium sp.]
MARRSIGEASKVVIAALLLGPPLGGIVVMGLLQIVPWVAADFPTPLPEFSKNFANALMLSIPLSYVLGVYSAIVGGLALAAFVSWGGRLTWWSSVAASLIYPAVLAIGSWIMTHDSPQTLPPVMMNAALIAVASASGALLTYLLLSRTAFVRRLNGSSQA